MIKRIFTFWEPRENMPEYLKLCMKTWKKFLPEYEVIILDYSNLEAWLGKNYFDKTLYSDYTLPKQADAIRCAILYKYGGIWFDTDTIITSTKFENLINKNSDLILIGWHIGNIIANKNSKILRKWLKEIKFNLIIHKICKNRIIRNFLRLFLKEYIGRLDRWDFLGNSILNKYLSKAKEKDFYSINRIDNCIFPEVVNYPEMTPYEAYQNYYFNDKIEFDSNIIYKNSGILCLHNSWTPPDYKAKKIDEIINAHCNLSHILKNILENGYDR